jgi:Uma2 family endonuclease
MSTIAKLLTAEDLWNMPGNGAGFELIDGELHPMAPSGQEHSNVGVNLVTLINAFVRKNRLGIVTGPDGGYILKHDPETVRVPDIGFVRSDRLPKGKATPKYFNGAPDLVVEIISPTDSYQDLDEKVQQYLEHGVKLVWVVTPRTRTITVFRIGNTITALHTTGVLSGEDVLPGFSANIAELFSNE